MEWSGRNRTGWRTLVAPNRHVGSRLSPTAGIGRRNARSEQSRLESGYFRLFFARRFLPSDPEVFGSGALAWEGTHGSGLLKFSDSGSSRAGPRSWGQNRGRGEANLPTG